MSKRERSVWVAIGPALALVAVMLTVAPDPGATQISFGVNRVLQVDATGDPSQNCQSLRDTLLSLENPSRENRYLIRLEPGGYRCGSEAAIVLDAGVTLEGAGLMSTNITGTIDSPLLGVVHMLDSTTLRDVTVRNFADTPSTNAIAVSVWSLTTARPNVRIEDVWLQALGPAEVGLALAAIDAAVNLTESIVQNPLRATGGADIVVAYSNLVDGFSTDASSSVVCRWSTDNSTPLDPWCQP